MENINLNELRNIAYKTACEHGFHDKRFSEEHFLCLIILELMEAVEAERKGRLGKNCKSRFEMDYNRYPALVEEEKRFKCSFENHVKDTLPDKLSNAVICLLDLAGLRGMEPQNENLIVAMQRLSFKERFVVTEYVLKGKPFKEIAQETGLKEKAVASAYDYFLLGTL